MLKLKQVEEDNNPEIIELKKQCKGTSSRFGKVVKDLLNEIDKKKVIEKKHLK